MDAFDIDVASIADIPLYNADIEEKGLPEPVVLLKQRLDEADGLLLVTPEYNNGIPGVLKNTLDWLSRPTPSVFRNKPVALAGASPGNFGTILAQTAWLPVLRTVGARYWSGGRLLVPRAHHAFNEDGDLTDQDVREKLRSFLEGFSDFIDG